jgi:hypothetical protein
VSEAEQPVRATSSTASPGHSHRIGPGWHVASERRPTLGACSPEASPTWRSC